MTRRSSAVLWLSLACWVALSQLPSPLAAQLPPPPPPPPLPAAPETPKASPGSRQQQAAVPPLGSRVSMPPAAADTAEVASKATPPDLKSQILERLGGSPKISCDYQSHLEVKERIFVACGEAGVLIFTRPNGDLSVTGSSQPGGTVIGFFEIDKKVWVRLTQEHAIAFTPGAQVSAVHLPTPPPAAAKVTKAPSDAALADEQSSPTARVTGRVTKVTGGNVIINLGTNDDLELNTHISLSTPHSSVSTDGDDDLIVGRVVELWEGEARLRIGVNEAVSVGMDAKAAQLPLSASRVAPPRVSDLWEVRVAARPFFSLGQLGGGVLTEGSLARRSKYLVYGVALSPLGVGVEKDSDAIYPWAGHFFGGYDSRLFSAGMGLGAQAVNDTSRMSSAGSALSLVQFMRLGSLDGLHLQSETHVTVFRSQTSFASMTMMGQLALSRNVWIQLRGGGGTVGTGFGELAVRTLLRGNGDADSLFLEVGLGGTAVFTDECETEGRIIMEGFNPCRELLVGGPMLALGLEWRVPELY